METVKLLGSLSSLIYRWGKKENEAYLYPQVANGNKSAVFFFVVVFIPLLQKKENHYVLGEEDWLVGLLYS